MADSSVTIFTKMFYEPGKAFGALGQGARPWLPLLAPMLLTAAVFLWYFSTVDFAWLVDRMVSSRAELKPEQAEAMRHAMSLGMLKWSAVGGSLIATPIMFALYGVYFLLAAKFLGSDRKYSEWFAFSAWVNVPRLLVIPLMALQIVTAHGQVAMEDLNMTNLNYLVFHVSPSSPWFSFLSGVDLTMFWVLALTVIGLRKLTGRSMGACVTAAVLPYVLIYGAWIAKIAIFN